MSQTSSVAGLEAEAVTLAGELELALAELLHRLVVWAPRALLALLVLALAIWLSGRLARGVVRAFEHPRLPETVRSFFRQLVRALVIIFGVSVALGILGLSGVAAGLLASSSLAAVIVGFAFQQAGTNLIAGVFLAFNRPFDIGDFIEVSGQQGTVREVDLRVTHIRAGDGRDIYVPNSSIVTGVLINHTRNGLRRRSITLKLPGGIDAMRATSRLAEALARVEGVLLQPPPAGGVNSVSVDAAEIEIYYWVAKSLDDEAQRSVHARALEASRKELLLLKAGDGPV